MMEDLFLTVLEISVSVGTVTLLLFLFSPFFGRRYAAGWSYLILTVLAVRLVVLYNWNPVNMALTIKIPLLASGTALPLTETGNLPRLSAEESVWHISPPQVIFGVWILGAVLVFGVHLFSYLHYRRKLVKGAEQSSDMKILQQFEALQKELKVHRKVSLLRSSEIAGPMALGFCHSLLVLPDREYTERELYFILRHELVHLKRGDLYVRLLFVAAEAVHWFNPLVWLLQRQAVIAMELACDEQVVRRMDYQERKSYTKALLSAMSGQDGMKIALSTHFSGGTEIMKKRFRNILEKKEKRNGLPFLCLSFVAVLALGTLVACQAETSTASSQGGAGYEQGTYASLPDQSAEDESQMNIGEENGYQSLPEDTATEMNAEEVSDGEKIGVFVSPSDPYVSVERGPDGEIHWMESIPAQIDENTVVVELDAEEFENVLRGAQEEELEALAERILAEIKKLQAESEMQLEREIQAAREMQAANDSQSVNAMQADKSN